MEREAAVLFREATEANLQGIVAACWLDLLVIASIDPILFSTS